MPDVRGRLIALGFEPVVNTPEEFGAQLRFEAARWTRVIGEARIKTIAVVAGADAFTGSRAFAAAGSNLPFRPGHREHRRRFRSARRQPSSSSAGALRNGDHADRADVRFARPNIQIYDAHVVDLYQWVCARHFVGVKGAETKASAVKLGSRPNFRKDYASFSKLCPVQKQSGGQPSKYENLPYISIGYGGESVRSTPFIFQTILFPFGRNPRFGPRYAKKVGSNPDCRPTRVTYFRVSSGRCYGVP